MYIKLYNVDCVWQLLSNYQENGNKTISANSKHMIYILP